MKDSLPPRLILAPIRGITDTIYRNAYSRYFAGLDLAIAPFVTTMQGKRKKQLRDLDPEKNRNLTVIPQILSKNPLHFRELATTLSEMGYKEVNWNLGCPYPMVANKKRGSGLLPFPAEIKKFLEQISGIELKLSIKTRLGYFQADEILKLLDIFNNFPLTELIIHPRTGKQMYTGKVDLEMFDRCLALSRHPVIYNGDIVSRNDFIRMAERFSRVSGWMIGRGILADPFLAARIKNLPLPDSRTAQLRLFHDEIFTAYQQVLFGPGHILGRMKGLWFYLVHSFADSRKILKKIQKSKNIKQYNKIVEQIFTKNINRQPQADSDHLTRKPGKPQPW